MSNVLANQSVWTAYELYKMYAVCISTVIRTLSKGFGSRQEKPAVLRAFALFRARISSTSRVVWEWERSHRP